jgi:hypothetical protein
MAGRSFPVEMRRGLVSGQALPLWEHLSGLVGFEGPFEAGGMSAVAKFGAVIYCGGYGTDYCSQY